MEEWECGEEFYVIEGDCLENCVDANFCVRERKISCPPEAAEPEKPHVHQSDKTGCQRFDRSSVSRCLSDNGIFATRGYQDIM